MRSTRSSAPCFLASSVNARLSLASHFPLVIPRVSPSATVDLRCDKSKSPATAESRLGTN